MRLYISIVVIVFEFALVLYISIISYPDTNDRNDSRIQVQLSSLDANCVYAVVAVFYLKTSRIQRTITRTFKKHSSLGLGYIRSVFACLRNKKNPNSKPIPGSFLPMRNVPTRNPRTNRVRQQSLSKNVSI